MREEFPGLRLRWTALDARVRGSSREVARRLRDLSDRYRGAGVVAMRTQPIPHAYRAFFRHVGVDPDAAWIPAEAAAVGRLLHGRFESRDALADALLIALVETGVPVWALDAGIVDGDSLGIRTAVAGTGSGARARVFPWPRGSSWSRTRSASMPRCSASRSQVMPRGRRLSGSCCSRSASTESRRSTSRSRCGSRRRRPRNALDPGGADAKLARAPERRQRWSFSNTTHVPWRTRNWRR